MHLTLDVVQGVGDLFWLYKKLSPYVTSMHWRICCGHPDEVEGRALPWAKIFPNVTAEIKTIDAGVYRKMATTRVPIERVLSGEITAYACNRPLDDGIRIEAIDPAYPFPDDVVLNRPDKNAAEHLGRYACLFVSGLSPESPQVWADRIPTGFKSVLLLGAFWDEEAMRACAAVLNGRGVQTELWVHEDPVKVLGGIAGASYMVAYESGLPILADNYDVPVLVVYPGFRKKLVRSWPKLRNLESGNYKYEFFTGAFRPIQRTRGSTVKSPRATHIRAPRKSRRPRR